MNSTVETLQPSTRSNPVKLTFILVISLFFLWALTGNLIPVLIPHLRKACQLNDFQSAFIDSAYWVSYFFFALPAAWVMRKWSYKTGIITGLLIAATGAILFFPAAELRSFGLFLFALFLVAAGMTFLETAANPYITIMGSKETAVQRLNFAQAFNGLGAFVAAFFLSKVILSGKEFSTEQLNAMNPEALNSYLLSEARSVQVPYLAIAGVLLLVALIFRLVHFPPVQEEHGGKLSINLRVFRHVHFRWGVIAQFAYVGAQVCISSFFIRYAGFSAGMPELEATTFLGMLLLCFMIGRYVGTFLMQKIAPRILLIIYSAACVLLLAYCVLQGGRIGVYFLLMVEFFMSIMFPTIFSLAIRDLGNETKSASAFLVMSIVGGALIPLGLGAIAYYYNVQLAYVVPMICFAVVLYYAWRHALPK
ncbi:L-fucose:H+ symporter permease [Chitinophaga niabensis]|uniref:MFS transporter, FHS family, L-fucose permease n=1 Tax=Chitinophaga niabensis TaxID=536979 RepID=A0A1N6DK35_9BACT|nr:L-fucose:H+ symporter permease [Chitinophaga niabensis]SIN71191.1 MFS transporter, FHS family, L-fucose permease [Chitinophaga niabensis]